MSGANNNGDFLACIQELEDAVPDAERRVFRKAAVHWVRLEEDMRNMKDAHTDPKTGKPFDIKRAYSNLEELSLQSDQLRRAYWWASGVGTMLTVVIALSGYIAKTTVDALADTIKQHSEDLDADKKIDQQQTLLLERLQVVQAGVVKELDAIRNRR